MISALQNSLSVRSVRTGRRHDGRSRGEATPISWSRSEGREIQVAARSESVDREIAKLVAETPGWSPESQLAKLFDLVCASADLGGDVLEVGSWCGLSAAVLGLAAQA